jgi:Pyruvate/2-oxoacid:ferredoxin oxidoreductase gamma subunit
VALGAFLGASGLVDLDLVKATLAETFAGRPKIVQLNHTCLDQGFAVGHRYAAVPAGR